MKNLLLALGIFNFVIIIALIGKADDNYMQKVKCERIIDSVLVSNNGNKITAKDLRFVLHEINNK